MNIILVSDNLTKPRSVTLTPLHLLLLGVAVLATIVGLAVGLQYLVLQHADTIDNPFIAALVKNAQEEQNRKMENYMRQNLDAMAIRLGEMQARLLRLDSVGERLAKQAGLKPQDLMFGQTPGQGGAETSSMPSYSMSMDDLSRQIDDLSQRVDDRGEKLSVLDSVMTFDNAKKKMTPSVLPINGGWLSSNFGYRIDPFTGKQVFHEGMDFPSPVGTPVRAAAGGVVTASEFNEFGYGNMVDIDHGNGLMTRYAHMSKRFVKVGDVVMSGSEIGEVGDTGHSTGPHLHFEVRQNGVPLNPTRFLRLHG